MGKGQLVRREVAIKKTVCDSQIPRGGSVPGLGDHTDRHQGWSKRENVGRSLLQGFCWEEHVRLGWASVNSVSGL